MKILIAASLIVLMGCIPPEQILDPSVPQILIQYPLPPIPPLVINPPSRISMALYIDSTGRVTKARLTNGSYGPAWDSLAIQTILRWQFVPARVNNKPISTWAHLRASIRYENPKPLLLAEIVCDDKETIDSIYQELVMGKNFGGLAKRFSVVASREHEGEIGEVNIYSYPEYIRDNLSLLEYDTITPPMKYGDRFIIFKRLKK